MLNRIMCIAFIGLMALSSHAVALVSAGKIIAADGQVSATNFDKDTRPIKRGDDFYVMDTIKTEASSTVSLRFTDGTLLELKENSSFQIKDYQFKQDTPQSDSYSSKLIEGGFRTITGALGKRNPDHYDVQARMTTLTIRGTEYVMNIQPDGSVQVGLLEGGATVTANNNSVYLTPNTNALIHTDGHIDRGEGVPASMMNGYSSNNINTLRTQSNNAGFGATTTDNGQGTIFLEGQGATKPPPPVGSSSPCAGVAGMAGAME